MEQQELVRRLDGNIQIDLAKMQKLNPSQYKFMVDKISHKFP